MPLDATHVKSAKYLVILTGVILFALDVNILHIIAFGLLFLFNVMYLSPDLDLPNTSPMQRWGILKIWFLLFEKKIKHRSAWSHGWIRGLVLIQLHFLLLVGVIILFLLFIWRMVVEPIIVRCNLEVGNVLQLNFSSTFLVGCVIFLSAAVAAQWHHKILDMLVKNK